MMKQQFNKKKISPYNLKEGELVYLEATNIHSEQPAKKLDYKWYSSFKIIRQIGASAYEL